MAAVGNAQGSPARRGRSAIVVPVVLALVAVLAVLAVVRERSAAQDAFDAALAAHAAGDCATALERYAEAQDTRFTPSSVEEPARENAEQCTAFLEAEQAGADEDWPAALAAYDDYLSTYPDSLLTQRATDARLEAHRALADSLLARADGLVGEGGTDPTRYLEALAQYAAVLSTYPDTEAAGRVPQSLITAYDRGAALLAEQRWCEAVPVLDVFVQFPDPALADAAGRATAALPRPLYECGLQRFAEGDIETAVGYLRRLRDTYPGDPLTAQARPTLIRAEVASITAVSAGEVPPPAAVGRAPGGRVSVEVVNDSPVELEVLFAGPEADAITIPACATCSEYVFAPVGGCAAGSLPTVSLELPPGSYQLGVRSISGADVVPYSGTWELASGTAYSSCFFIVSSFG